MFSDDDICHPNWPDYATWSNEALTALKDYMGIEIINMVIYRLRGSGLATEQWDYLLSNNHLI
jgi:hypothetical protein